jgi:hypothetical protein
MFVDIARDAQSGERPRVSGTVHRPAEYKHRETAGLLADAPDERWAVSERDVQQHQVDGWGFPGERAAQCGRGPDAHRPVAGLAQRVSEPLTHVDVGGSNK